MKDKGRIKLILWIGIFSLIVGAWGVWSGNYMSRLYSEPNVYKNESAFFFLALGPILIYFSVRLLYKKKKDS